MTKTALGRQQKLHCAIFGCSLKCGLGASVNLLRVIVGLVAGLVCFPALAGLEPVCKEPNIATCPSFFVDQCASDAAFQVKNSSACMRILAGKVVDNPTCADINTKQCLSEAAAKNCAAIDNGLDRFFCKRGHSQCPKSIPEIQSGYDKVLKEFVSALSVYQTVLDLDLKKVNDMKSLCGYSLGQLTNFKSVAEQDKQELKRFDGQLGSLESCGNTLQLFLVSERPKEISQELWEIIKSTQTEGIKQVTERKGALTTKQERLSKAPAEIGALTVAYRIACPQTPSPDSPKQDQPRRIQ